MKKKLFVASVLMIGMLLSVNAQAALDQSQDNWSTANGVSTTDFVAQSFTQGAGLDKLTSIWIRNYAWETFPAKLICELRKGNWSGSPFDLPLVASVEKTWATLPDDSWLAFDFANVGVVPGDVYFFVVKGTEVGHVVPGLLHTSDGYAGGYLKTTSNGGGYWNNYWGRDLTFRTYSVPEPATMSLLVLGLGSMLLRRR